MSAEIISLAERRAEGVQIEHTHEGSTKYQLECLLWSIACNLGIEKEGPFRGGPPWVRRTKP